MREYQDGDTLITEYTFEDWIQLKFSYKPEIFYVEYVSEGQKKMKILKIGDGERIKAKQKELFEQSVKAELEILKKKFLTTYNDTREPQAFRDSHIKVMRSLLKKEEFPINSFTLMNEVIVIEEWHFTRDDIEAIRKQYVKRIVQNDLDFSSVKMAMQYSVRVRDYSMKAEVYYAFWKWLEAGKFNESNAGASLREKLSAKIEKGKSEPFDNIELKGDSLDKATIKGAVRKINEIFDVQSTSSFVPNPVELPKISPSQNYGKSVTSSQLEQIGQVLKLLPQDERGAALQKILDENADRKVGLKATNQSNEVIEMLDSDHELQLHEFLISSNLIGVSWKEFENHLKPFEKLVKIQWMGTEPQILCLFDELKKNKLLRTENINPLIEAHFITKKGKSFKRGQLASSFYKMGVSNSRGLNPIIQFVQELKS